MIDAAEARPASGTDFHCRERLGGLLKHDRYTPNDGTQRAPRAGDLVSVEQPYLTAGQSYWIWIAAGDGSAVAWGQNVTGVTGHMITYYNNFYLGYIWESLGVDNHNGAVRVDVLEPALTVDQDQVPSQTGGTVNFQLNAGPDHANRNYLLLGGISGADPGYLLPGGLATLPVNLDSITFNVVLPLVNSAVFQDFSGTLDSQGQATSQLNAPPVPGLAGVPMTFAYFCSDPFDFASNPVQVDFVQ